MKLTDELERLEALRGSGALTDTEFAAAKAQVLAAAPPDAAASASVQRDLQRLQLQSELLRLDQDWSEKREEYLLHGKAGRTSVPTVGNSIGGGVFLGLLALMFALIGANMPHGEGLETVGLLAAIVSVPVGFYTYSKAKTYEAAYSAYQQKRTALTDQLAALG